MERAGPSYRGRAMDLITQSIKSVFDDSDFIVSNKAYQAFIFILVTPSDSEIFLDFLSSSLDIHYATGSEILVFAPSIRRHDDKIFTVRELT